VQERRQHAGPARADRVAQRDAAAADVELVLADPQRLDVAQELRREGLVDLEQVDVADRPPRPLEGALRMPVIGASKMSLGSTPLVPSSRSSPSA
jgi:hypothetical protein